jgi:hypothetical protein
MGDEYSDYGSSEGYGSAGTSYTTTADGTTNTGGGSDFLSTIGSILSGGSGSMAQLASLGGIGALLNSIGGGSGGGFSGYQGKIPKYTSSRKQYAVPTDGRMTGYQPSDAEIVNYMARPGMTDAVFARNMNQFGITPNRVANLTQTPISQINSLYQNAMGPNMAARRPGSGGVTYFSPMTYTPQTAAPAAPATTPAATTTPGVGGEDLSYQVFAAGGMAQGGLGSLGHYSDGGRLLKGPGDGVSDSIPAMIGKNQPARLADGEFVIPARIVSEIGNGSTDAGARKLYAMMDRIQKARGKTLKNVAANSKADKHLPA